MTENLDDSKAPSISFVFVPPYGAFLNLKGEVHRASPTQFRVAVCIKVHGGWWTKPYWDAPLTAIFPDGTFSVEITTGGEDEHATEIAAFLVPADYRPHSLAGEESIPAELLTRAVAQARAERSPTSPAPA